MHNFTGKSILVTGSTRGIGRAVAGALLNLGATVGIHGRDIETARNTGSELSPDQDRIVPVAGDFTAPENASQVVQEFVEKAGCLDGLVNNAGGGKVAAFRSVTLEKWRHTFSVNLDAAMCASQAAYLVMREQQQGSIVNIASAAAHGRGGGMGADYAASKAALVSLTKSLAAEAARYGIRVNSVSPGMVETDMSALLDDKRKQSFNIPMNRFARPDEIAGPVIFLLSEESAYITGQVIHANGGLIM